MTHLVKQSTGEIFHIPEGDEHLTIGRGPLLEIRDRRVSRNHAWLCLKTEKFSICPKHTNPCFYKPLGGTSYTALAKDHWKELHNGDCFALLQNGELSFQVVCREEATDSPRHDSPTTQQDVGEEEEPVNQDDLKQDIVEKVTTTPSEDGSLALQQGVAEDEPVNQDLQQETTTPSEQSPPASQQDVVDDLLFGDLLPTPAKEVTKEESLSNNNEEDCEPLKGEKTVTDLPLLEVAESETRVSCDEQPPSPSLAAATDGNKLHTTTRDNEPLEMDASLSHSKETSVNITSKPAGSTGRKRVLPKWLVETPSDSSVPVAKKKSKEAIPKRRAAQGKKSSTTKRRDTVRSESPLAESPDIIKPPPTKRQCPILKQAGEKKSVAFEATAAAPSLTTTDDTPSGSEEVPLIKAPSDELPSTEDDIQDSIPASERADSKKNRLPPCPYGTKCYRKNPVHFREFAHDFAAADSDSGEEGAHEFDNKPLCPYGVHCYRKNPAHFMAYAHTPRPLPASGARETRQSKRPKTGNKRSVLDDDSDNDDQPNTYDYADSFIDDDDGGGSSGSKYDGDSEDSDWVPEEEGKKEGEGNNEEDVSELVADAEEFIRNKKMRR